MRSFGPSGRHYWGRLIESGLLSPRLLRARVSTSQPELLPIPTIGAVTLPPAKGDSETPPERSAVVG